MDVFGIFHQLFQGANSKHSGHRECGGRAARSRAGGRYRLARTAAEALRRIVTFAAILSVATAGVPLQASIITWDAETDLNWSTATNWSGDLEPTASDDVVFPTPVPNPNVLPEPWLIALTAGELANSLRFLDNYTLTGGDLTLTSGQISVGFANAATIESLLSGSAGLTLTGGGTLRLTNSLNDYTGTTTINGGSLIISNQAQLGTDTSAIHVTAGNGTPSNLNLIGFTGGSLVLDGSAGGFTFTRDLNLEGRGPLGNYGAALRSIGNNTLSGQVNAATSTQTPATFRNTRIISTGTLTISGGIDVGGTAGTTITTLGGNNSAGIGNFVISGTLTGAGYLEKIGSGTLFLNPSDTSGFSGRIRVSGSAAGGQSSVRVTSLNDGLNTTNIFGTANGTTTAAPIDMNGGVLEIRSDSSLNFGKNVYQRASSTMFVGPAVGGQGVNETMTFGDYRTVANLTTTFNSRNGYGITFGPWTQETSNNPSTITNNMGGTLTFLGNAWNNDNGSARTLTIGGNGNTVITGSINTSGAGLKTLTKTGTGSLTIEGVATTLNGPVNINGGAVVITDFRSLNNNTETINIGTGTTAGALIIGTSVTPTAAGLTTSKVINLAGTTGAVAIYANQTGVNPVVLNANFTATGTGTKTLTLGGINSANNIINGAIVQNGTTNVTKIGSGTWVLAGANTYTGTTTIAGGTLKIQDTHDGTSSRNVIGDTNVMTFDANAVSGSAGGVLEYVGTAGQNSLEALGALTPTAGAGTVKVTPGLGGTAKLTFASFGTNNYNNIINFISDATNTVTVSTLAGYQNNRLLYFNGADFAFFATGVVRAPIYGTDADFAAKNTVTSGTHAWYDANTAINAAAAQRSIKIEGNTTLTLNANIIVHNATSTTAPSANVGNILATGGNAVIDGTGLLRTPSTQALGIRVNGATDTLTINTSLNNATPGTGGITKSGLGTLYLNGTNNNNTGEFRILEGSVVLGAGARLGGDGFTTFTALRIYNSAQTTASSSLDLGGNSIGVNAIDGNGIITTNGGNATITVGNANGTGTWNGIFQNGTGGVLSVTKTGTGAQTWSGLNSYTGATTILGGLITVDYLANGGEDSGIGASSSDAANLVFGNGGLVYRGSNIEGNLTLGSRSASTDRLFTVSGNGVTLSSTATNNNAIVWSHFGAIVHGTNSDRTLTLTGTSTGDNTFNPQWTNSAGFISSLTKTGAGQWNLGNSNNTYTGLTTINEGILGLNHNGAIHDDSPIVLNPTSATSAAILQMSGVFDRNLSATPTAGTGSITWAWTIDSTTGGAGFAAHADALVVAIGGLATPTALTWGAGGFVGTGGVQNLVLNSTTALSYVDFRNAINLGGAQRTVNVLDNVNTGADFAVMSGVLSGTGGSLRKIGAGILVLTGDNTYTGTTAVEAGTLVVSSLGSSGTAGATSVGDQMNANTNASAVVLGNADTGAGILQYVGAGETSDRKIRLNTTTGSTQFHADGTGALILTNVANDMALGAKTLHLRGTSADANMITSQLSDNGGALGVTVDGSAMWILTNAANNYTGTTTVSGGALGIGHDSAIGGTLVNSNGNIFAYGGDRTITNNLTLTISATNGWLGDYSLTFNGTNSWSGDNVLNTYNSIVAGKALTINGVTANAITANRTWTFDGPGETIITGDFTTSTAFGIPITKNGDGTLTLGTNGATSNWNKNNVNIDVDRGTLKFIADNAIPALAGHGGLILSPEVLTADTAILDLNGTTQTVNAFTATTDGTVIIDNTSASAATFRFGANNSAVNFGSGLGSYTIQNTGAGALSIVKLGNTTATFNSGVTVGNAGVIASEGGGTFNITGLVTAASGLRAIDGSTLALTGGITNPHLMTSLEVGGGSTLSLLDGLGTPFANLTTLSLGNTGAGTVTLNLNIGTGATDTLTLLAGGTLNLGNTITFNMTDAGLNANTTYTLLSVADGGIAAFGIGNMLQGATPGGFDSFTWFVDDNVVQLTTGNLLIGDIYWRGATDNTWNGAANNWSDDKAGTIPATSIPGQGNTVIFAYNGIGAGALTTTLEQNFKINNLIFEAGTTTPSSVTINPGALATARLEIAPQSDTDGIAITTGGPPAVAINTALRLGANQTWDIADAGSTLTLGGALLGEANVTKTGAGRVILSAAADPTFNSGQTAVFTVSGGRLEMTNVAALGTVANSNLASLVVNAGGTFYTNNATASTTLNPITLAGGTLSAGGNTQTYSNVVTVSAASTISMLDPVTLLNGRNITLSGGLSGTGNLTVDSINTVTAGNQITGTLTLNQDNSAWSGNWNILRGSISTNNVNGLGSGSTITAEKGRILFTGTAGSRTLGHEIIIASATENALLEFNQAAGIAYTYTGQVTLGGAGGTGELRVTSANDAATATFTGGVVLANNGLIGVTNAATRVLHVDSVISETGGPRSLRINDATFGSTAGTVRLTGANTFTGNVTVNRGILEFTTVTNAGGGPSSLGQGTAIDTVAASTLRFIGDGVGAQSTNRTITSGTGVLTLSADGVAVTDTITYAGAITITPTADGSQLILTGAAGRHGIITGGFTQTGTTADVTLNSGIWTLSGAVNTVADDFVVVGPDAVLNLDSTGVLTLLSGGTGADLTIRNGATVNINAANAVVYTGANYRLFVGQGADGADAVLNLNANLESGRFILGERNLTRVGIVNGAGTLTVSDGTANAIELYRGEFNANLANSVAGAGFNKLGSGTVTLRGDNSGLTHTTATIINDGVLILDYTLNNATKIRAASALDMRGAELRIVGNNSAATLQTVASFTLATGSGNSIIDVTAGTGQTATLALGAITRAASAGTLRINLNNAGAAVTTSTANTNGIVGLAAYTTVKDSTGTWFGTNSSGSIVGLASTFQNDISLWGSGNHISNSAGGFTGSVTASHLNSLRFDATGSNALNFAAGGVLTIASGGILVTDQVTSASPGLFGGTLGTGVTEIIVTQDSSQVFEISSRIGVNNAVTKTGSGTLRLSGSNAYTGTTSIQNGVLQISGGNAISDTGIVTLATNRNSTLQLLSSETIGRISGGQRAANSDYGVVDIGTHTLTLNQTAATTFSGRFEGTGTVVKSGGSTFTYNGTDGPLGFTGNLVINQGLMVLSGATGNQLAAVSGITLTGNTSSLRFDNDQTTAVASRINNSATITLNSTAGITADALGFYMRRTAGSSMGTQQVGQLVLNSGHNVVAADGTATDRIARINFVNPTPLVRSNFSTLLVVARNMAATSGQRGRISFSVDPGGSIGGGGAAGTTTINIFPYMVAEDASVAPSGATHFGNTLVRYDSGTTDLKPLNLTTEYVNNEAAYNALGAGVLTNNVRFTATPGAALDSDTTGINALVLDHATGITVTGPAQALQITSGAILSASAGANVIDGFTTLTTGPGNPYYIYVTNPNGSLTLSTTSLSSAQALVKSGAGTLILGASNSVTSVYLNQGALQIGDLDHIGGGTGALVFAGGALRLGAGFTDDISTRTISFLLGGGTLDTNGIDLTLANSLGSGVGGFTKTGNGELTLGAAATYTGPTLLSTGTITVGANNALGNGGDLTLAGGTTLAFSGSHTLTHGIVTTSGASPLITGTGTIVANQGFVFNHTGDTTIAAALAGAGGLFKLQTNDITLTGLSTYTGTTEVRAGGLVFDSISSVGGGPSALGNPGTVEDGVIRMGLTTAPTTLTYTGTGHLSDRLIGMQGTTGGLSLFGNGTGAVGYGGARFETPGNKILTLRGTSDAAIVNRIGALTEIGGVLTLNKTDANTWMINGASSYTGVTQIDDGTLMIGVNNALPSVTTVRLGTGTTAGTFDLNGFDQTIASLLSQTNSTTLTNNLIIDAANTLTVTGAVTIGANVATSTTLFAATGGGSFVNTNSGGTFQVGGATGGTNVNAATADFSGLANLTIDVGATGLVRIGDNSTVTGGTTGNSTILLANDSTITAGTLQIASTQTNTTQTLRLGSGTNVLNVNTLTVGGVLRASGVLDFHSATGTVTLRAADGSSAAAVNLAVNTANTANNNTATVDLTGHSADLLISTLTMADRTQNTGFATASFSFDQGTLDITTLVMARRTSTGTGNATATTNIGGGTAVIGSTTMAVNTSAGGTVIANLNITGGNVTFGTGSGTAINMANAVTGRTVTSNLTLTGGSVNVTGNIVRTGGAGTENATVTLNGATLDMNGNSIGTAAALVAFAAQSGTLQNLGQLNGGGVLTKSTAGLLILEGTNTYTGGTTITAGTLQVGSGSGTGTLGGGNVVNGGILAFHRNNAMTVSNAISGTGEVRQTGSGTTSLTGPNTYTGATNVNAGTLVLTTGGSLGNTAITVASGATFSARAGNGTLTAGLTGAGTEGATLTLDAGSLFDMGDGEIGVLHIRAQDTFAGLDSLTIGAALGTAPILTFDLGTTLGAIDLLQLDKNVSVLASGGQIAFNLLGGTLVSGDYTFITATGGLGVAGLTLVQDQYLIDGKTFNLSMDNSTSTAQILSISVMTPTVAYWSGQVDSVWSTFQPGDVTNWRTDINSNIDTQALPDATTNVFFSTTSPVATNLNTTLGADFAIHSLNFESTASSVTIGGSHLLTVGVAGVNVAAGSAAHTLNTDIALGAAQAWTNNSTVGLLTVSAGRTISGAGRDLTITGAGDFDIQAAIATTTGWLTKSGAGSLTLGGASSYSGGTFIIGGTVFVSADGNLGASTGGLTLNSGTLGVTSSFSTTRATTLEAGNGTFQVADGVTLTHNGTIGGTGGFTKTGTGTMALTSTGAGQYAFDGGVTISQGRLELGTGVQLESGGGVLVNNGGVLGGTGTILDTVTVSFGGRVDPGFSPGNPEYANFTLEGGSRYKFEINSLTGTPGTNWDLITVTNTLTIDSTAIGTPIVVELTSLDAFNQPGLVDGWDPDTYPNTPYYWKFLEFSNLVTPNNDPLDPSWFQVNALAFQNLPVINPLAFQVIQGDGVYLAADALYVHYTAVPEPGSMLLVGLGALGIAGYGWRRRKQRLAQQPAEATTTSSAV